MGLDMYLYGLDDEDQETFTKVKKLIQEYEGGYYTDEIKDLLNDFWDKEGDDLAYWRKANAIHKFFCDRGEVIDKDIYYIITREDIGQLLHLCIQILVMQDEEYSHCNLPTQEGFFFGPLEYDSYYYEKVQNTIEMLSKILKEYEYDKFLYYASW